MRPKDGTFTAARRRCTGKTTLLLSHLSREHTVFAIDDTDTWYSLKRVRESPQLKLDTVRFVIGPTQATLPRHEFSEERLQLVLLDGPHGYPFPELEYYFFLPHLDTGGLLIVDDIHIPTIHRLFSFLREEEMFDYVGRVATTAFFRRTRAPLFDPHGDVWWLQEFNRRRFPIRDLEHVPAPVGMSPELQRLLHQESDDGSRRP